MASDGICGDAVGRAPLAAICLPRQTVVQPSLSKAAVVVAAAAAAAAVAGFVMSSIWYGISWWTAGFRGS